MVFIILEAIKGEKKQKQKQTVLSRNRKDSFQAHDLYGTVDLH